MKMPFAIRSMALVYLVSMNCVALAEDDDSANPITDYLIAAPVAQTDTSVTMGLALGFSAGSIHTNVSGSDSVHQRSDGLSGVLGEANIGYALAMPYNMYGALGLFIDNRSNIAELETGNSSTSYTFRQKSVYGLTLSGGWHFDRGDILYGTVGHTESNFERSGMESANTGANFHRVYRDSGLQYGLGFLMAADTNSFWRYEFVTTPQFSEYTNTYNDSTFKYKTTNSEFKVGWQYYISGLPLRSKQFTPLALDGVYLNLLLSEDNLMLDHKYEIDVTTGASMLVEKFTRPSLNLMGGFGIGFGSTLSTSNFYAGVEYSYRSHISQDKVHNRIHNAQENFLYRLHQVKVSSLIFGYRPHPSDMFFGRLGYTSNVLQQVDATPSSNVNLALNGRGTLMGFGFETSLVSMLSVMGEYDTAWRSKSGNLVISPTSHIFIQA